MNHVWHIIAVLFVVAVRHATASAGKSGEASSLRGSLRHGWWTNTGAINSLEFRLDDGILHYDGTNTDCSVGPGGKSLGMNGEVKGGSPLSCEDVLLSFPGQQCKCTFEIKEEDSNYSVKHPCVPYQCFSITGVSGNDSPGANVWPCQGTGCYEHLENMIVNIMGNPPPPTPPPTPQPTFKEKWVGWLDGELQLSTESKIKEGRQTSEASSTDIGAKISASYGIASASVSANHKTKSDSAKQSSKFTAEQVDAELAPCPTGQKRWRVAYVQGDGSSIMSNLNWCTPTAQGPPRCDYQQCGDATCSCCLSTEPKC